MATSETPNSAPAASPSSSPSARCVTRRCAEIARRAAPTANTAASTAISAASDELLRPSGAAAGHPDDGQPCGRDRDAEPLPSSEAKVEEPLGEDREEHEATGEDGLHDRQRRAARARRRAAPTRGSRPASPTANHFERKRAAALRSGCRARIGAARTAPRYLHRKATLVARADASAISSPRIMQKGGVVTGRPAGIAADVGGRGMALG